MNFIKLTLLSLLSVFVSCDSSLSTGPYSSIAGFTQGTTYHMTYQSPTADTIDLTEEVNAWLAEFDQSLSTYIDTSNISRINRNLTDQADKYLEDVFKESKRVNKITDGAFDITVGPLIDAWGFGPGRKMTISAEVIDSMLQYVGMDKVRIEDGRVIKDFPETRLDVNAIAQGFSVDVVAEYFDSKKIKNYMIEIGGELITKGLSPRKDKWKIGIDKPFFGNQMVGNDLQAVVKLSGKALASSGNYRKYYEVDGKKIVHTIDPKTGYTKMSNLLSVTIITDKCMTADGLSTSCMVLGFEKAKEFISAQENVEALFIYTDEDGLFLEWMTDGMKEML